MVLELYGARVSRPLRNETVRSPDSKVILTVQDVAQYLRIHQSMVYRLLKEKQLPAFKIGGHGGSIGNRSTAGVRARSKI
jgi:excisionase family DNA binding protein